MYEAVAPGAGGGGMEKRACSSSLAEDGLVEEEKVEALFKPAAAGRLRPLLILIV